MTHGGDDVVVSPQDTYDFFNKAGSTDKKMKIYGGAHYGLFYEFCRDEVMDDYIAWIKLCNHFVFMLQCT